MLALSLARGSLEIEIPGWRRPESAPSNASSTKCVAWSCSCMRSRTIIGAFQPLLPGLHSSVPHVSITTYGLRTGESRPAMAGHCRVRGLGAREPLPPSNIGGGRTALRTLSFTQIWLLAVYSSTNCGRITLLRIFLSACS
jgi:hypothetical protein